MLHLLSELDKAPAREDLHECQVMMSSLRRQIRNDVTDVVRGECQALHIILEEGLQDMKRAQQEPLQQQISAILALLYPEPPLPAFVSPAFAGTPLVSPRNDATFPPNTRSTEKTPEKVSIPSCCSSASAELPHQQQVKAAVAAAIENAVRAASPAVVTAASPMPSIASFSSRSIDDIGGEEKERNSGSGSGTFGNPRQSIMNSTELELKTTPIESPPAPSVALSVAPVDILSVTKVAEEHVPLQPKSDHDGGSQPPASRSPMQDLVAASGWVNKHTQDEQDKARFQRLRTSSNAGRCTSRCRSCLLSLVLHPAFDAVSGLLIISNAVYMGIKTQVSLSAAKDGDNLENTGPGLPEYFFTGLFGMEWLIRLLAYQGLFFKTKERGWHLFDTVIIVSGAAELLLQVPAFSPGDFETNGETMIFRILRTIRLMRLLKVGRFVHSFRELRLLISGLMGSTRSLAWSIVFLLLVMYIFGIFFEQGVVSYMRRSDKTDPTRVELLTWFGSMEITMITLFCAISGGTDWLTIMTPLAEIGGLYTVVFVIYIFMTYHGILHVMMSVFVDCTMTASRNDRDLVIAEELSRKDSYLTQMGEVFRETDVDGSGTVSWEEFETKLQDPRIQAYFSALDLEVAEAKGLFHLLDAEESNNIPIEEFVVGCFRLKGGAKGIDLAALMHENKKMVKTFHRFKDNCQTHFSDVDARLQSIVAQLPTPPQSIRN